MQSYRNRERERERERDRERERERERLHRYTRVHADAGKERGAPARPWSRRSWSS